MQIVVQKYGGSSVADVDRLMRVAERVAATARGGRRVCVVVSAMGDTTDELSALARRVSPSPPRRELDMLLSAGERISMSLLSMAIQRFGIEAISFTGSQSGIITNDRHSGARIVEVRPYRIQDELERGRVVIVAGFQGVSYRREVTTLGRGGSDTTAVALAAALGAEYCEICSDVDGVLSADPRVVPEARRRNEISYDEMQELASAGAKVLNAQAVEWARRAGITIYARSTHGGGAGTVVTGSAAGRDGAIAVAGARALTRLVLASGEPGRLAEALAAGGVEVRSLSAEGGAVVALFGRDDLPDWAALRRGLEAEFGAALTVDDDVGAVTVVGHGVGIQPQNVCRALALVRAAGAAVLGVESSPLRLTVLVPPAYVDDLTRAWHAAFVGS